MALLPVANSCSTVLPAKVTRPPLFRNAMAIVWALALLKLVFHIYFNNRYGYFRDEFDYLACGEHLQWGYVDQPPLIPFLTHICRTLLGDSLRSIRFIPAVASSLLVVQAAVVAREFGARLYAQVLTAICVIIAPQYLSNGSLLTTNCLEPNLWMGCVYCAVLAINRRDPRYWLWFGVIAGMGLEEKYTIAIFGLGMVIGLLLTKQRHFLVTRWSWFGGLAALLIFLPNVLWNLHHDWPFVQLIRAIKAENRDVVLGPFSYFVQQTLLLHPITAPIWLVGLGGFFWARQLRPYRLLGWCYLVCYGVLFALHGKAYYLAPIYPMLLAAGAVIIEAALEGERQERQRLQWLKPLMVIVLLASGVHLLPVVVPIFSPERFVAYTKTLPFKLPVTEHSHVGFALPQWYFDQFGWKEIADATEVAWDRVPAAARSDCGIFAQDYGQAGAVDFFGREHGLPPAMSGDRTYFLWGPRGYSGNCMVVLDDRPEVLERYWRRVTLITISKDNPYAGERNIPVFWCEGKKFESWTKLWPNLKRWR